MIKYSSNWSKYGVYSKIRLIYNVESLFNIKAKRSLWSEIFQLIWQVGKGSFERKKWYWFMNSSMVKPGKYDHKVHLFYQCQTLSFNKVAVLMHAILFRKTPKQMFFYEFCKIFKKRFFTEQLRIPAADWSSFKSKSHNKVNNCNPNS